MITFEDFNVSKQLTNAIAELNFELPTPIQIESFPVILSGKDMVGIAQTGTGKTLAYMLPVLHELKFSKQLNPRILILVPTRELVLQVVSQIEIFSKYQNIRVLGVYGGVNINTQKQQVSEGTDILVATPGRLYDLTISGVLQLKSVNKLVIDEVDVMLDLGFRFQLTNIFDLLPAKRQNIMFSATMTDEIEALIDDFFIVPTKVSIAVSGTPLENIEQVCYNVQNFYTKINLLQHLLKDKETYSKVLIFVSDKKSADLTFELLDQEFQGEICVIHSNKTQNYRIRSIEQFNQGKNRVIVATDVMARGLDLDNISHVINVDTPRFPENYMHRIGRTGRASQLGKSILLYTSKEEPFKILIEKLMNYQIPFIDFPIEVSVSTELTPEERPTNIEKDSGNKKVEYISKAFHEKSEKNKKTNQGKSYRRELAKKYKKPKTRGDKNFNKNLKKK